MFRYNGLVFQTFTTLDSLADNFITCAINDGSPYVVRSYERWYIPFITGEVFQAIPVGLSDPGPVTCMGKSNDNEIWMSRL